MIYTIGYVGRKPEELKKLAEELDAIVLDIRFSPLSRIPHWNGEALSKLLRLRYRHVPSLGNLNYKNGGPIMIADYRLGRETIIQQSRNVILMCVCKSLGLCHRRVVGDFLRREGIEVKDL